MVVRVFRLFSFARVIGDSGSQPVHGTLLENGRKHTDKSENKN